MIVSISSLGVGLIVGYLGQRSRMCTIGGLRDCVLVRDTGPPEGRRGDARRRPGSSSASSARSAGSSAGTRPARRRDDPERPRARSPRSSIGGLLLGFFTTLSGACPLRQHVLAGQGRVGAWAFLGRLLHRRGRLHELDLAAHRGVGPVKHRTSTSTTPPPRGRSRRASSRRSRTSSRTPAATPAGRATAARSPRRAPSASRASASPTCSAPRRPDDLVFTKNATEALNLAILGLAAGVTRVVTTSLEHNSVMRPLRELERAGPLLDRHRPCRREHRRDRPRRVGGAARRARRRAWRSRRTPRTSPACSSRSASWRDSPRERSRPFVVDASQSAGHIPLDAHGARRLGGGDARAQGPARAHPEPGCSTSRRASRSSR